MPPLTALIATQPSGVPVKDGMFTVPILPPPVAGPVNPPLDAPILPDPGPMIAPYVRGTGGTPFVVSAGIEKPTVAVPFQPYPLRPVISPYEPPDPATDPMAQAIVNPNQAVPAQPPRPLPQGTKVIMPVPTGLQPVKRPVAPMTTEVPVPGPIQGTVAGFDLGQVPWWGWAIVAVVGVKLLVR